MSAGARRRRRGSGQEPPFVVSEFDERRRTNAHRPPSFVKKSDRICASPHYISERQILVAIDRLRDIAGRGARGGRARRTAAIGGPCGGRGGRALRLRRWRCNILF